MRILAFDASAQAASAAVLEDGRFLAASYQNTGLTHSRTLLPMTEGMLRSADIPLESIDVLAVSQGPGSFTGLRIAVSLVKGMAYPKNLPCAGVSTLESMAWMQPAGDALICAVMDARAGQVYNALFDVARGAPHRLCEDRAVTVAALAQEMEQTKKKYILVGDGAELCYNQMRNNPGVCLTPPQLRFQNAQGVALAAQYAGESAFVTCAALAPRYLRLPQAERERLARAAAEGPQA